VTRTNPESRIARAGDEEKGDEGGSPAVSVISTFPCVRAYTLPSLTPPPTRA